jgi:hypothetical protein
MSHRTRIVTISAVLCSIICVAILHIVRADLSPLSHRLSEYANGKYGWMMTAAFVTLGGGVMVLGVTIWARRGPAKGRWIILATAIMAAVGTLLSGVFRTGDSDFSEAIHSRASALAVVAIVALALTSSIPFADRNARAPLDFVGAGLAVTSAVLTLVSPALHNTRWTGLSQRLLWIALVTWLLRTAWIYRHSRSYASKLSS